jgi:mono/diheme cytochrome c family protein
MRSSAVIVVVLFALVGSAASAGKARASKPYVRLAQVPEDARVRANPFDDDPTAPIAGRKLFERHCMECHGANAESGRKGPSLRAREVQEAPAGALFWVITNGNVRAGMPVWSKLPAPQRWQITTYLKSLGVSEGPRP